MNRKIVIIGFLLIGCGLGFFQNCSKTSFIDKADVKSEHIVQKENSSESRALNSSSKPPNIIFFLLDDQGAEAPEGNWHKFMPTLNDKIIKKGVTFSNSFVSNSLCCPSRSTILTGLYSHNTGVYDNLPPKGGYDRFYENGEGKEKATIAIALQKAGYETILLGKYINSFPADNGLDYIPPGWDHFTSGFSDQKSCFCGKITKFCKKEENKQSPECKKCEGQKPAEHFLSNYSSTDNSQYPIWRNKFKDTGCSPEFTESAYKQFKYHIVSNRSVEYYDDKPDSYLQEILTKKAVNFLKTERNNSKPFFMYFSSYSPHWPYTFAPKYKKHELIDKMSAPRPKNFNSFPLKWQTMFKSGTYELNADAVAHIDIDYRNRLKAMLSVDDSLKTILEELEAKNELSNTYVLFYSDNGYHLGNHCLDPSKATELLEDLRVPFYIMGPNIPSKVIDKAVLNTDISPTIASLAGLYEDRIVQHSDFDGRSVMPLIKDSNVSNWRQSFLIEHGENSSVVDPQDNSDTLVDSRARPPSFYGLLTSDHLFVEFIQKSVKLDEISNKDNPAYDPYWNFEFFNIKKDPYQTRDLTLEFPDSPSLGYFEFLKLRMNDLKNCGCDTRGTCSNQKDSIKSCAEAENASVDYLAFLTGISETDLETMSPSFKKDKLLVKNCTEKYNDPLYLSRSARANKIECQSLVNECVAAGFREGCSLISKGVWANCIRPVGNGDLVPGVSFTKEDAKDCLRAK